MNKYALRQTPLTVVIGFVLAGGSVTAQAGTITVNTTDDAPVGTLPGLCTLRSAVASANIDTNLDACDVGVGSAGADEIVFAPGLANSTITLSEGQMEITSALTITGPVPGDSTGMIIDGDGESRIFRVSGDAPYAFFDVRLDSISLTGGYADTSGGGVWLRVENGSVTLTHCTVSGNTAGSGGGLFVLDGNATLTNSTVSNNTAFFGGGLFVSSSGDVTLTNSTVSGNTATNSNGGGLLFTSDGNVTLTNSTVSGNTANSTGGGLSIINSSNIRLTHSTVAYNTANNAKSTDGIHLIGSSSSLTLNNSLVVQAGEDEIACNQAADKHSNNAVTDSSCTGTSVPLPALIAIHPLADNGGPTQTHALNAVSIAIDAAGDCETDFSITADQRGAPRPVDGDGSGTAECDIGAYEFQDVLFRDRFEQ